MRTPFITSKLQVLFVVTILTLKERAKAGGLKSTSEDLPDGDNPTDSSVDWKISENKKLNKTECYDQESVIIRRDGSINVTASFSREINETGDVLGFELKTGKKPNLKSGTMVRIDCGINGVLEQDQWNAIATASGNNVDMTIKVPVGAAIGRYKAEFKIAENRKF